jgi:hypothetical protein
MDAALMVMALLLAGQTPWTPDRYQTPPPAAAPTYDRYQLPSRPGTTGVSPPPSIADRARAAVTETATTLRDGVEAGIQATSEQITRGSEQLYDNSRTAGQEFAQEFQQWAGGAAPEFAPLNTYPRSTAGQPTSGRGPVSNPFVTATPAQPAAPKSRGGFAPPPWAGATPTTEPEWATESAAPVSTDRMAALGAGPAQIDRGWTSIRSDLAPPKLLLPQLMNSTEPPATRQQAAAASGPSFPAFGNQPQTVRAATIQSQQAPAAADATDDGWALGWGPNAAQPATIGRYDTQPATSRQQPQPALPAVAARPENKQSATQTAQSQPFDPWGDSDPWAEPANAQPGPPQSAPSASSPQAPAPSGPVLPQVATGTGDVPPVGTAANQGGGVGPAASAGAAVTTSATPAIANAQPVAPKTGDEAPWVPLLVVSLSLAGSIGANLFLGWSYMDARQKYRALVQKTANTFRRKAAAA